MEHFELTAAGAVLLIDDSLDNIQAAEQLGTYGIHVDSRTAFNVVTGQYRLISKKTPEV
jgi:FMN phosphatase YigB (HAD superfamily)